MNDLEPMPPCRLSAKSVLWATQVSLEFSDSIKKMSSTLLKIGARVLTS